MSIFNTVSISIEILIPSLEVPLFTGEPSEQLQQPFDASHTERHPLGVRERHERHEGHGQHTEHGRHEVIGHGHVVRAALAATGRSEDAAAG